MPLYEFEGKSPVIAKSAFIHPQAVIIGDVKIGSESYIGAGAVIRGDIGKISIGNRSNVQENSVIHADKDTVAAIGDQVLIGHSAVVHGPCFIGENSVIGMGAIVSIDCEIGAASLIAAGSLLPPRFIVPPRKLVMGHPARIIKDLDEGMIEINTYGVNHYQELAKRCIKGLKLVD